MGVAHRGSPGSASLRGSSTNSTPAQPATRCRLGRLAVVRLRRPCTAPAAPGTSDPVPWKVEWQLSPAAQQRSANWAAVDPAANVKRAALAESGLAPGAFDAQYAALVSVLPDLPAAVHRLPPRTLAAAVRDPVATGAKLIALKSALPGTNVGMVLLLHPPLLVMEADAILGGLQHLQAACGAEAAETLVQWYPAMLDAGVYDRAMAELRRLVPHVVRKGSAQDLLHMLGVVLKSGKVLGTPDGEAEGRQP